MTWTQIHEYIQGCDRDEAIPRMISCYGLDRGEAEARAYETVDADALLDRHYGEELGTGRAVRFFRDVDLGHKCTFGIGRGQVSFADYECAGPDRWCSEAANTLSLSLLQARLNDLNTDIHISIISGRIFGT